MFPQREDPLQVEQFVLHLFCGVFLLPASEAERYSILWSISPPLSQVFHFVAASGIPFCAASGIPFLRSRYPPFHAASGILRVCGRFRYPPLLRTFQVSSVFAVVSGILRFCGRFRYPPVLRTFQVSSIFCLASGILRFMLLQVFHFVEYFSSLLPDLCCRLAKHHKLGLVSNATQHVSAQYRSEMECRNLLEIRRAIRDCGESVALRARVGELGGGPSGAGCGGCGSGRCRHGQR